MAEGKRVTAGDLELTDALNGLPPQTLKGAREGVEREMVQDALRRHRGKITSARALFFRNPRRGAGTMDCQ